MSGNGDEAFVSGLLVIDSTKGNKKKKGKYGKKTNPILREFAITAKNQVIGSETIQRKQRKILLLLLFRMTPRWESIWL